MRDRFFFSEKKRREEKKKIKKKKKSSKETVQKSSHQIALSSQIFRHSSSLFFGKIGSPHLCSSQQQTTLEDQNPHTTYIIKKNFLLSVAPTK
jgi:uncharacterized membrane protein